MTASVDLHAQLEDAYKTIRALVAGWTRFDSAVESTWPPANVFVLAVDDEGHYNIGTFERWLYSPPSWEFGDEWGLEPVVWWRPLPPTPEES